MRMTTIYTTMAVLLFFAASETASAQSVEGACPLSAFKNGQTVTVHGKVGQASHDMALVVPGCSEAAVLVYAGDPESRESSEKLLKDESFKRFEKYTRATYGKIGSKGICMQCPKYEVEATLTGRLDVAPDSFPEGQWKDKLGMLHDQSGKFVGKAGFGHPPIQKYQLIIEAVSDVAARELPKPKVSSNGSSKRPGGPAFRRRTTKWVPHPSRLFAKGGWQTDRTMGFAFHAACARNEIFPQPSFTRTGPDSSRT